MGKMNNLTPKQEAYAQLIAKGTLNQSEAYRDAYDTEKMTDKQVWEEASKLSKNPKVAQRIEELRKPALEAIKYTVEQHFADLNAMKELATTKEQLSVAMKALENMGKLYQFYVEKKQVEDITPPIIKDDI